MCLAVPGRIIEVKDSGDEVVGRTAVVDFQGSRVEVSLALVPQASAGSWVLVHAGFALNELDEEDARQTWRWLQETELMGAPPGRPEGEAASGDEPASASED